MARVMAAHTQEEEEVVRPLFAEYAALPHTVGRWDDSEGEVKSLPGPYAPPLGAMLLALADELTDGCVAIRALDPPATCEMKAPLRARDDARPGRGPRARRSVDRACSGTRLLSDEARHGSAALGRLRALGALYLSLGLREIDRYRDDLYADALCFELALG